ncbi:hypothetical protein [Metallosphaera sedula]|uniref:hypothetical protein n=1 Tax=Metallosphaera sedula TaxID=43687 RepID=UPI0020BD61EA|nr:hypothetical protein [Metallosphaera sedula]BBL45981.1 hypothetical protein MJ1HA_0068 [Metallosphaera sedula]
MSDRRKTNLALQIEIYRLLKLASYYKLEHMTDIVETAVMEYFINHKDEFPEMKKQIEQVLR